MRMRKKKWVKDFILNENKYFLKEPKAKPNNSTFKKVFLEIGSGLGDFIIETAYLNPDNLYYAYEKDLNCVAVSIKKAYLKNLNNIYFINGEASNIKDWFKHDELDGMYLLFSDPWPKKGYYKRRLTYKLFLDLYKDILKNEAFIYFKTDNYDLYTFSHIQFQEASFKILEESTDFHIQFACSVLTGYEKRYLKQDMPIYYIKALNDKVKNNV